MPSVEALKTSSHCGLRMASVDHDAVVPAPGEARGETETLVGPSGAALGGFPVVENTAALRAMFKSQYGACSDDPVALDRLVEDAMRCAESYALECGFRRRSPRAAHGRPRV